REMMKDMEKVPGVTGVAPFTINPMMVTRGERTATGVLLKGIDPERVSDVLDLPKHIVSGGLEGLRVPGTKPPESRREQLNRTTYPSKGKKSAAEKGASELDEEGDLFDQIDDLLDDAQEE